MSSVGVATSVLYVGINLNPILASTGQRETRLLASYYEPLNFITTDLEDKDFGAITLTVQTVRKHTQTGVIGQHCIKPFLQETHHTANAIRTAFDHQ